MNDNEYGYLEPNIQQTPKPPKKSGKWLGIVSILLCIAFVCGVAGYAIGNSKQSNELAAQSSDTQNSSDSDSDSSQQDSSSKGSFSLESSSLSTSSRTDRSGSEIVCKTNDAEVIITPMIPYSGSSGYGFDFGSDGSGSYPFGSAGAVQRIHGSGFFISADGYIVTNYHVIEGAESVTVTLNDGSTVDATIVGSDEDTDIAVLKIAGSGISYSVLGDSDSIQSATSA
jgi:serine protease Do